ncbi:MAG: nitrite/sulfite reductase [Dehalococcoidia bacterium]
MTTTGQQEPTTTPTPPWKEGLRDQTLEEKSSIDYSKGVIPYVPQEVDDFEAEVERFLRGEWATEEAFIAYRLIRGIYGQRQPDAQMVRIKLPFGGITADEMDVMGEIVDGYVPLKKGHVTTRENIQLHFVKLKDTPTIMRMLGDVGVTTREACGNTVRNVVGCPLAGVTPDEAFYATPYLVAFARWFVRHPYTQKLPRKFKVAFASCADDCVVTAIHDLAFIPRIKVDVKGVERQGFEILTGGGTSIMPRIAYTIYDFVPVEEYLKVSEAIIRVFHRTDELRKNRMKARIKFYIDRVGIDAFREEVEEELKKRWARRSFDPSPLMGVPDEELDAPPPPVKAGGNGHQNPAFQRWLETNVKPQKQEGYNVVWVKLSLGDIQANQFAPLAAIARKYAAHRIRTTTEQNIVYRWVPDGYLHQVWKELQETGLGDSGAQEITDVVACPGTDSCKLGITSSMGLGDALRETLTEMAIDDPLVKSLHVKISGCPNGCGRHHIANIGFHGAAMRNERNQIPSYEMFVAGNYGNGDPTRFGQRIKSKVPAKRVPDLVRHVVHFYQEQRQDSEKFNDFVDRVGKEPFEEIAQQYKEVGLMSRETLPTYMDWGKKIPFKVERGEGECAI